MYEKIRHIFLGIKRTERHKHSNMIYSFCSNSFLFTLQKRRGLYELNQFIRGISSNQPILVGFKMDKDLGMVLDLGMVMELVMVIV